MKKIISLILSLITTHGVFSQCTNLVQNGNFESMSSCPSNMTQITLAVPWDRIIPLAGLTATPDYFNMCAGSLVSVPTNNMGYQFAYSGSGYAGVITYMGLSAFGTLPPDPDYREYMQQMLSTPMIPGETYQVSFWVSLSDKSRFAADGIGALFTTALPSPPDFNVISFPTPQVNNPMGNILTDTIGWTQINQSFVATQPYQFIIIGNFKNMASTQAVINDPYIGAPPSAYYYIDDVSVECISCNSQNDIDSLVTCDSLTWIDGINYSASTSTPTFTIVGGAANGCDSVVTLNLTINTTATGTDVQTVCNSFTWIDGITYTTSTNTPTFTLVGGAVSGCDSVVTLNLTINTFVSGNANAIICQGDSMLLGGAFQTTAGNYNDTIVGGASNGCDSIVTTNLTVNPAISFVQNFNECQGFSVIVGSNMYNTTGNFVDTLVSASGCDSVVTTNLTINSSSTFTQNFNECQGFSVIVGSNMYNTTGNFVDTLVSASGCDSIVTTNLTVNPTATFTQNPVICQGDSVVINGNSYTTTGNYNDTLLGGAANGCDSIVTTNLTVNPTATSNTNATICQGNSIFLGGAFQTTAGNYNDTIVGGGANGCDSIITTTLTINPSASSNQNPIICQGQPFTLPSGIIVTTTGVFIDTLQNAAANGCDSIVTTNLTVNPAVSFVQNFNECQGFSVTVGTNNYTTTGNFIDTLTATSGCDSIVTTNLTITTPIVTNQAFNECQGFSVTVGTNTYTTSGIYTDVMNGCDTVITDLTINPPPTLTLIKVDDNCGGNTGSITALVTTTNPPVTYNWNTGDNDSVISNLPVGTYNLTINDASGCVNSDTINVLDLEIECDFFIFIPNVFTPNGDGQNDEFLIHLKGLKIINLEIYNRWGLKLFETSDISQGWDGRTNSGSEVSDGTYFYILNYKNNDKTQVENGTLTLLR